MLFMSDVEIAKNILNDGNFTCVMCRGNDVLKETERGVLPLIGLIDSGAELLGYSVADKVVGKAAALLFVYMGITEVYTPVMSDGAKSILTQYNIKYSCEKIVPYIINRAGDGACPMENAVKEIDSPAEALEAVRKRLSQF